MADGTLLLCAVGGVFVPLVVFVVTAVHFVTEYQRFVVIRLGRFIADNEPGFVLIIPMIDSVR